MPIRWYPHDITPEPKTIQKLVDVYPSFAMLAGMQLDLFTPLKAGPMRPEQIANAIGVDVAKLKPLLYALVAAELLTVEGDRFANTDEANHFLVRAAVHLIWVEYIHCMRICGTQCTANGRIHPHRETTSQARLHADAPRSVRYVLPRFASGVPSQQDGHW